MMYSPWRACLLATGLVLKTGPRVQRLEGKLSPVSRMRRPKFKWRCGGVGPEDVNYEPSDTGVVHQLPFLSAKFLVSVVLVAKGLKYKGNR